jgi:hypothetical protein
LVTTAASESTESAKGVKGGGGSGGGEAARLKITDWQSVVVAMAQVPVLLDARRVCVHAAERPRVV